MLVQLISQGTESAVAETARHIGASFAVCGQIFQAGETNSIYVVVLDLDSSSACLRESIKLPKGSQGKMMIADAVAQRVATILADPILGMVPKMLAHRFEDTRLAAIMSAYQFIATQDSSILGDTIARLNAIKHLRETPPLVRSLLADMLRVSGNMQINNCKASPLEILELAETAFMEDRENSTAQLAYGYALLNSGDSRRANMVAQQFIATSKAMETFNCDARLLIALSSTPASNQVEQVQARNKDFFIDEFSDLVTFIRGEDYSRAACLISDSSNGNIFWLHLLGAAVYGEINEHDLAVKSAARVKRMLPRIEDIAAPMISGFFPDINDRGLLFDSIRRSGIRI